MREDQWCERKWKACAVREEDMRQAYGMERRAERIKPSRAAAYFPAPLVLQRPLALRLNLYRRDMGRKSKHHNSNRRSRNQKVRFRLDWGDSDEEVLGAAPEKNTMAELPYEAASVSSETQVKPTEAAAAAPEAAFLLAETAIAMAALLDVHDDIGEELVPSTLRPDMRDLYLNVRSRTFRRRMLSRDPPPPPVHKYTPIFPYRSPERKPRDPTEVLLQELKEFQEETDTRIKYMRKLMGESE
ncbi:hypothetical protein CALCODRAFT_136425 [Calocera cornea HHB12733]|uniref:Uncharacterized protein n=1 Tax=Calocera cornea HHB12733 TaxID=1353952 RepID=A0A165CUS3_9BASI|nr:hypothetical protein CALCODRAFT_136425 [Calocera cornea HHB12733]